MRQNKMYVQSGFALLAAVLVTFVLIALGILVFILTTRDYRVSAAILSERQAMTTAESGVHDLVTTFNPENPGGSFKVNQKVASDVSQYTYTISPPLDGSGTEKPITSGYGPDLRPIPGDEANQSGQAFFRVRYTFDVTGNDSVTGTSVQLNIGLGYGPVQID